MPLSDEERAELLRLREMERVEAAELEQIRLEQIANMGSEEFRFIKQTLQKIFICGEISDREGYTAACAMKLGHQGHHGWEPGVGSLKLYCKNPACRDKGGFITRTMEDAKKTIYTCDSCGKPMQP